MLFKQSNGTMTSIPTSLYGELVVVPSVIMRGIFASQADATADLVNCPAGSSIQVGSLNPDGQSADFLIGTSPSWQNFHIANPIYLVAQKSNGSFVALFPTTQTAASYAAVKALEGIPCISASGTLVAQ